MSPFIALFIQGNIHLQHSTTTLCIGYAPCSCSVGANYVLGTALDTGAYLGLFLEHAVKLRCCILNIFYYILFMQTSMHALQHGVCTL